MTNELILTIISTIVTAVVIPLITLLGKKLIAWIGAKLKNETAAGNLIKATGIVTSAVQSILQTYVEALKKDGNFDKEAQAKAFAMCKSVIAEQLTDDIKNFLNEAYGDFELWINTQIEATLNTLKNNKTAEG